MLKLRFIEVAMTITLDDIKKIAERLRDRLSKFDDFKGLYVYGSRIYGNPRPDSDLDMVAVFNKELPYEVSNEITGEVIDIELEFDILIPLFKMTEKELNLNYLFYNEIKRGLFYEPKQARIN